MKLTQNSGTQNWN